MYNYIATHRLQNLEKKKNEPDGRVYGGPRPARRQAPNHQITQGGDPNGNYSTRSRGEQEMQE